MFSLSGRTPDEKANLKKTDKLFVIQSFHIGKILIFIGMLLGPLVFFTTNIRYHVYDFFVCGWLDENRLTTWDFQELIKRLVRKTNFPLSIWSN